MIGKENFNIIMEGRWQVIIILLKNYPFSWLGGFVIFFKNDGCVVLPVLDNNLSNGFLFCVHHCLEK